MYYRVNRYFAIFTAQQIFKILAVGKLTQSAIDTIPQRVLLYAKYLCIHPYISNVSARTWSQLASANIVGIRYEGCFFNPIQADLGKYLSIASTPISTFSIKLSLCRMSGSSLLGFEEVMQMLSATVTSLSVDLVHYLDDGLYALHIVQKRFSKLRSIQLLHLDAVSAVWALSGDWTCLHCLSRLVVYRSFLPFERIGQFVISATNVEDLVVEECFPWDANNGVACLKLQRYRVFRHLAVQATYPGISGPNPVYIVRC